MTRKRITRKNALEMVTTLTKEKPLNFEELKKKTNMSKGSLHRFLVDFKKEKSIGFKIQSKEKGLGREEVYYPSEISLIEGKMKGFLIEKNKLNKNERFPWTVFPRIAFGLKIDHTKPEFIAAMKNISEEYEFIWAPTDTPPWIK